jgi:hypothetical protein
MKKLVVALLMLPLIPLTYGAATAQNARRATLQGKTLWEETPRAATAMVSKVRVRSDRSRRTRFELRAVQESRA